MADYFTRNHFSLLNEWSGQRKESGNVEHQRVYDELADAYRVTEAWAKAVQERGFPQGYVDVLKKPTNQASNFAAYNWARIYPYGDAPETLAYTVGIDRTGFVVKIDTVGLDASDQTRQAFIALREKSRISSRLSIEEGLEISLANLAEWSVAEIRSFNLTYDAVAQQLGLLHTSEPASSSSVQTLLEDVLNSYGEARESGFGGHAIHASMRRLEQTIRQLAPVAQRATIKVVGSFGKGNWATIPWLALLDSRETQTTQHGTYVVFLFREDLSGVYLTLNQGVTDPLKQLGRRQGYEELQNKARAIRRIGTSMNRAGFQLDDRIDLRTRKAGLGRDYEASTVAHKLYARGRVPADGVISNDLEAVLSAYDAYLAGRAPEPASVAKTWIFQSNPQYYDLFGAVHAERQIAFEVRQHSDEIRPGDRVFLWQSGNDAGIVASATVGSPPTERGFPASESRFARAPERFASSVARVDLRIDTTLSRPVLRRDLLGVPGLRELSILRGPQGTNFRVSAEEAALLADLLEGAVTNPPPILPNTDLAAVVNSFSAALERSGLSFTMDRVRSFVTSLATKRFAILTGLSGSGKTQLALRLGQWCGSERVRIIPVRPDWTGPEYLIGYEDALLPTEDGRRAWNVPDALEFILRAAADPQFPHILVLDEMNLAHVERYFADVLSGIESDEPCIPNLVFEGGYWRVDDEDSPKLRVPDNLFIVGTVNIDETTFMFSPKVLDRANTIEFRIHHSELTSSPRRPQPLAAGPEELVRGFVEVARDADFHLTHRAPGADEFETALRALHEILAGGGFEFGHRTFIEASRFASMFAAAGDADWKQALDLQVLQKLLPRLHGSRRRLEPLVKRLDEFCVGLNGRADGTETSPALPRSRVRLAILHRSLVANQFAGFVE